MSVELRKIFVVFKTHFDLGFTGLVHEVLDTYAHEMIPQALEACRRSAEKDPGHRYVWTLPAWPLAHSLQRLRGTPLGDELERRVREGLITWHALPLTTHTELLGLEDLIRGLFVARNLGERFRRMAAAAKMTDVPGHTWILPSLLSAAGIRFLHLGCNPCSTPPDVPFLFRWEGPDGSGVTTMYSRGGYGTPLLPPQDWNLPIWLALQHTQDNVGPQDAQVIPEILRVVRERSPQTEVVFASLDDFAGALAALNPGLPVVRKDLADSWIHGVGSMPAEVAELRGLRSRLVQLESAWMLRSLRSRDAGLEEARLSAGIREAYEKILLFGEHTWGMDTKLALNPPESGGRVYDKDSFKKVREAGGYARIERSWKDKADFVSEAKARVRDLELHLNEGKAGAAETLPARLEVFNHHPWEWSGPLRLGKFSPGVTAASGPDGTDLAVFHIDGDAWAVVQSVPALGSLPLLVQKADGLQQAIASTPRGFKAAVGRERDRLTLENGRVRIRVDEDSSGITSLKDLETGRDWVDRKAGPLFGAYQYDVYSRREIVAYLKSYAYDLTPWFLDDFGKPWYPDIPHRSFTGKLAGIEREGGPGWARLRLRWSQDPESVRDFGNAARVELTLTLFDDQPWVDLSYRLAGKEECPLLEAGHVVFPFAVQRPRYAINKTGTVVDPARDIAPDANRLMHACEGWVDVFDGHDGILVIPFDSPLVSIGSPAIEKFDGSAQPGPPVLFFNLFNTQWGTNFPQWIGGNFTFRFRLVPHRGTWREARAWEHAAAALQPPVCLRLDRAAPPSAPQTREPAGLLVKPVTDLETVTLKRSEKGDGMILRLREASGRGGKRILLLRLPTGSRRSRIIVCSLLEEEKKVLPLERAGDHVRVTLELRPFEVVTVKMKFQP